MAGEGPKQDEAARPAADNAGEPKPKATGWEKIRGAIFSWPGFFVGFVAGLATIWGFWGDHLRPIFSGPDLQLRLTECSSSRISLSVQNKGGRPAIVSRPTFRRFREGTLEDLPIIDFVGSDPFTTDNHSRIEPDGGYVLDYPSPDIPLFLGEWWEGHDCPVRARMKVDGAGEVAAECPCAR